MGKIVKPYQFFAEKYFIFPAVFCVLLGVILLLKPGSTNHYHFFGFGAVWIIGWFLQRRRLLKIQVESYISWDQDRIKMKEFEQLHEYPLEEIDRIYLESDHLWIKSGTANGTMLDVSGYKKKDVQRLQCFISKFSSELEEANKFENAQDLLKTVGGNK